MQFLLIACWGFNCIRPEPSHVDPCMHPLWSSRCCFRMCQHSVRLAAIHLCTLVLNGCCYV